MNSEFRENNRNISHNKLISPELLLSMFITPDNSGWLIYHSFEEYHELEAYQLSRIYCISDCKSLGPSPSIAGPLSRIDRD